MSVPEGRRERLAASIRQAGLDRFLVVDRYDLRWLTGFTGTAGVALCPADPQEDGIFVTDFRYMEQAPEQLPDGWEILRHRKGELIGGGLADALEGRALGRVGFDPRQVTVAQHAELIEGLGDRAGLVEAEALVESLRQVKEPAEVERIAAAASLADEALVSVLEGGLAGRTEREVAAELEVAMIRLGADELSFPPIVAGGPHGALPHAEPRDAEILDGCLVTIDWGARLDGYCSDCTRTYATGEVGEEERRAYEAVNVAREAGVAALAPGVTGREADAVAREVIDGAGFGEAFGHGLGHGVGLDVHELPRLSPRGSTEPLAEGMVVTVEPGVYVPGSFGVRIEDLVEVRGGAPRVITSLDREFTIVG